MQLPHNTERRCLCSMENHITKLLGLKDVIVKNIEEDALSISISIELPRRSHRCASCGLNTDRVHDYRTQRVKDLSAFGKGIYLLFRKRRYVCSCGKRFYEDNSFLPRYYRMTSRSIADIIAGFRKAASATQIAKDHNISVSTAQRYFDYVSHRNKSLPCVLSIDEFKGNAGGEKYQTIVTDLKNKTVLDILPNRYESDLIAYFNSFHNRDNVHFFVSDMNPHFKRVAKTCFPKAILIADRFHVIRQVVWDMEKVRKNEQKKLSADFRKYFKCSKNLLCKNPKKLTDAEKDRLAIMFNISPRLARAYDLKNRFLAFMHCGGSAEGRKLLSHWLLLAQVEDLPEFETSVTACTNWSQEILNALDYPWTNGFTEGCNNKIKVIKRLSYGVRNFNRFRNRLLFCLS